MTETRIGSSKQRSGMCKSVAGSVSSRGWWVWASGSYTQPWVSWSAVKELCSLHSQDPAGAVRNTLKSRVPQQFSLSRKEASGETRALHSASSDGLVWRRSASFHTPMSREES